jgi:hypothetical protein
MSGSNSLGKANSASSVRNKLPNQSKSDLIQLNLLSWIIFGQLIIVKIAPWIVFRHLNQLVESRQWFFCYCFSRRRTTDAASSLPKKDINYQSTRFDVTHKAGSIPKTYFLFHTEHSKNYSLSREGMAEGIFPPLLHWGIFPQIEELMNKGNHSLK